MPRPQRPLDPEAGPVRAFAAELRRVREKAGNPKYLQMARLTGRSRTALSEAAGGDHLASWETVEAYLTACRQDPVPWQPKWEAVRAQIRPSQPAATDPPAGISPASSPVLRRARKWWLTLAAAGLAGAAIAAVVLAMPNAARHGDLASANMFVRPPGSAVIIVQNKVAIGPSSLTEDVTPAYLSTRAEPACANNGCMVTGTRMWSGAILYATCQLQGIPMTNEDLASPGIKHNPGGVTSALWYRAQTRAGRTGYISEVYLTPASRGGLHLPHCTRQASP